MKFKLTKNTFGPTVELYIETEKYVFTFWVYKTIRVTKSIIKDYEV